MIEANMDDPYLVQRKISYAVKNINKYMKQVGELAKVKTKLTSHISRHSFAQQSATKIPPRILQQLFRHSDLKTTEGYMNNFIQEEADQAIDTVVKI